MRYVVIGAGAVGGAIGGRLAQSGHQVVLVARGAHAQAMRADGLRLDTPEESLLLRPAVAEGPEDVELTPDDVLLLAVKVQDSVAALDAWARRPVAGGGTAGERLPLLCAQNGVAGDRLALRRFRRVHPVCVWLPAQYLTPGRVVAPCAPYTGMLHLGDYPARPDGMDEATLRPIADDLERSRFLAFLTPEVSHWKYAKLLANLANSLEALCGPLADDRRLTEAYDLVRAEGEAVLTAAGIPWVSQRRERELRGERMRIRPVPGAEPSANSSWQSLRRGTGSIEADYLNGEIVLLGRLHGVPTPWNATLSRLAGTFAAEGREPGSLPVAELLTEVDGAAA
ncbi:2-dehydropantoate 2-reductase N-terminal domain-containing protein [Streptomyces sp. DSM 44915]|uniref:2-dehydropantoate 2-reductase N-terminal domain-containing protein n=1 Tax=Streptomyces chisholmiae TaxID=3075540 RepID=A0ABU2JPY0_9ACTN|nr:2-dehydropantoate 2-reductase N-terminal domain-containing protein [Streptomyces sp. DSM 44915]MDT0267046.1 2-dehydropantoate 2-reductase N-terminal domain-containing protein [Streptomyces sp. DSM 44915]